MKRLLLILLGALLMTTACRKDEDRTVDLTAVLSDQPARGGAKVYIDDERFACWHDGDYVNVNGESYTLTVEPGSDYKVAKILDVDASDIGYVGAYPYSCFSDISEAGTSATVTIPSVQTYSRATVYDGTGDSYQQLLNPMVAHCYQEHVMKFHNVGCVLKVTIENNSGYDLDMHFVTVEASTAYLAGSAPVLRIGSDTPEMEKPTSGYHGITVDCSDSPIILNDGDDTSLYVVSAPFENQTLTVRVLAKDPDGDTIYYTMKATSGSPLSLDRNQMGMATFELEECTCQSENATGRCNYAFWGCGTETNPFLITSSADLFRLQGYMGTSENATYNKSTVYYRQIKDVDASGSTWTNTNKYFYAHYDGGGYSINLALAYTGGFVERVYGAEFKNLTLTGTCASTIGTDAALGAFADFVYGATARFENCTNRIPVRSKGRLGGFVGQCREATVFKGCSNDASVTGGTGTFVGGFIGQIMGSVTMEDCTNTSNGSISGAGRVGGMVGGNDDGAGPLIIKGKTTNNGSIFSSDDYCGGILGGAWVSFTVDASATVTNNGVINSTAGVVGGIIGACKNAPCNILGKAVNNNTVTSTKNYVGGIVGNATVACSVYCAQNNATGSIQGTYGIGGIAGYCSGAKSIISDCINNGAIEGTYDQGGIAGMASGTGISFVRDTNNNTVKSTSNNSDKGLGGIIGRVPSGSCTVDACLNKASLTSTNGGNNLYMGGIVGNNLGVLTVRNCGVSSTCTMTAKNCKFGVAGIAANKNSVVITNCYSNATITFTGATNYVVSGIATLNNSANSGTITVENCYFGGSVTDYTNVTSFGSMACRYNNGTRTITHCYSITNFHKGSNYNDATYTFTGNGYVSSSESDLLTGLNDWVSATNASLGTATYSLWSQTTSGGTPTELPHF